METRNMQHKSKSFSINALMRNTRISKALTDAWDAPLGSTKRDHARSLLKSVASAKRNSMHDGQGGGDLFNINQGPATPGQTSNTDVNNLGSVVTNGEYAAPEITGSGFQFVNADFDLPGYNKSGQLTSNISRDPAVNSGEMFKKESEISDFDKILNINGGNKPMGDNTYGQTLGSPLDMESNNEFKPNADPSYKGINLPYTYKEINGGENDSKLGLNKIEQINPDGTTTPTAGYAYLSHPNTGDKTVKLIKATPFQKAIYLGEEIVKENLTELQKKLVEESGWSLSDKQEVRDGFLYIPNDYNIELVEQYRARGYEYKFDKERGAWIVLEPSADTPAVEGPEGFIGPLNQEQQYEEKLNAFEEAIKALGLGEEYPNDGDIDGSKLNIPGTEGIQEYMRRLDISMAPGPKKDAVMEAIKMVMYNPGDTPEKRVALAKKLLKDEYLLSFITKVPLSEVQAGITLAGAQEDAYNLALTESDMGRARDEYNRQTNAGVGYDLALARYLRNKDGYIKQIDEMTKSAKEKMKTLNTSNPYVANRMAKYMNFLDVSRGAANQNYTNMLRIGIAESDNAIQLALNGITQAQHKFDFELANNLQAGKEKYDELYGETLAWAQTLYGLNDFHDANQLNKANLANIRADTATTIAKNNETTEKPISVSDNKALLEAVEEKQLWTVEAVKSYMGDNVGITTNQIINGIENGGKAAIETSATTGSYSDAMYGLQNSLNSMVENEQVDLAKLQSLKYSYKMALERGLIKYVQESTAVSNALRKVIVDINNFTEEYIDDNGLQSALNGQTEDKDDKVLAQQQVAAAILGDENVASVQAKRDDASSTTVADFMSSSANFYSMYGSFPSYSDDNYKFGEKVAEDISSIYSYTSQQ